MLDARGILADQQRLEVFDRADDRQLAVAEAGFAHARDALIGIDGDEQVVAGAVEDGERLDSGDLHVGRLSLPRGVVRWRKAS